MGHPNLLLPFQQKENKRERQRKKAGKEIVCPSRARARYSSTFRHGLALLFHPRRTVARRRDTRRSGVWLRRHTPLPTRGGGNLHPSAACRASCFLGQASARANRATTTVPTSGRDTPALLASFTVHPSTGHLWLAVLLLGEQKGGSAYAVFWDSTAAIERAMTDRCGPRKTSAKAIIELGKLLSRRGCSVTIRWTRAPAHEGVEGNGPTGSYAKQAAETHSDAVDRKYRVASFGYLPQND